MPPRPAPRSRPRRRRPADGQPAEGGGAHIGDHGVIGDLRTAALVSPEGTIDWLCWPHFDSPSLFGSLLDPDGGHFSIQPAEPFRVRRLYVPRTNVLVTRFHTRGGTAELVDFMPVADASRRRVVRILTVLRGSVEVAVECRPRPGYGKACWATAVRDGIRFTSGKEEFTLQGTVPLQAGAGQATARLRLAAGDGPAAFQFGDGQAVPEDAAALRRETEGHWRRWLEDCTYKGRWRDAVERSALVLKLLSFEPTGAMVAAATTSLPSRPGGTRNWDYRYTWVRDSSFVLYALLRIGFKQEAKRLMDWLVERCCEGPALRPVYTIHGKPVPDEEELPLRGYLGGRPVRVGNAATDHLQLDTYGAVLDAAYLFNKYGMPLGDGLWTHLRGLLEWLEDNWQRPDTSIWETRRRPRPFTFSRVMCWVAFDRGIRIAERRSFPAPLERWRRVRDDIRAWVLENCYDDGLRSFVQAPGSRSLDGSALLVPLTFFAAPMDDAVVSTVRAIQRRLGPDGLVRRMEEGSPADTGRGEDGAFVVCSFWLVEALTRQGRLEEARQAFEMLRSHAGALGLYAEQIGDDGLARGNFPQALTHLSLISAAFNLDRALEEGRPRSPAPAGGTAWRAFVAPQETETKPS